MEKTIENIFNSETFIETYNKIVPVISRLADYANNRHLCIISVDMEKTLSVSSDIVMFETDKYTIKFFNRVPGKHADTWDCIYTSMIINNRFVDTVSCKN